MTLSRVVVAGGTGFIGKRLTAALAQAGVSVTVLTRSATPSGLASGVSTRVWTPNSGDASAWRDALCGADAVINLCGHPIATRWSAATKQQIVRSRLDTTDALVRAIVDLAPEARPKCYVGSSAVGYYGPSLSATFDESSDAATDFLADLCAQWEAAAMQLARETDAVRVVLVRTGIVLGGEGGALQKMLPIFKAYLGGPVGSGQQWMSWVHVDDLVRIFIRAAQVASMSGAYNGTGPTPVTMGEFCEALAETMARPNLFAVPGFAVKLLFGEGASVVLDGNRVVPKRLLEEGFEFTYSDARSALKAVVDEGY